VDDATREQQNALTGILRGRPNGYWHYYSDMWLVVSMEEEWTVSSLRDAVQRVLPGKWTFVAEIDSGDKWAAFGVTTQFDWLKQQWEPN
jgi:hypothetical protein